MSTKELKRHTKVVRGDLPFSTIADAQSAYFCVKEGCKIGRYVDARVYLDKFLGELSCRSGLVRIRMEILGMESETLDSVVDCIVDGGLDLVLSEYRHEDPVTPVKSYVVTDVYTVRGSVDTLHCEELLCAVGPRIDCGRPPLLTRIASYCVEKGLVSRTIRPDCVDIGKLTGSGSDEFVGITMCNGDDSLDGQPDVEVHICDSDRLDCAQTFEYVVDAVNRCGMNVVVRNNMTNGRVEYLLVNEIVPVYANGWIAELICKTCGMVSIAKPFHFLVAGKRCLESRSRESQFVEPKIKSRSDLGKVMHRMFDEVCEGATHLFSLSLALRDDKPRTYVGIAADHVDVGCEAFWIGANDLESLHDYDHFGEEALQRLRARVHDYEKDPYTLEIRRGSDVFEGVIRDVFLDEYETDNVRAVILLDFPARQKKS